MSHIVIIGSGFAACTAVKTLREQGYKDEISLISPRAELFYFPSLIWVPAGKRTYQDLAIPLHDFLKKNNVCYIQSAVSNVDDKTKTIQTETGLVPYDVVIICSGGQYIRKLPGIENAEISCSGWKDTKAFSDKLASLNSGTIAFGFAGNPKEPSAMRGGPIFEFLFGVDTLLKQQKRRKKFNLVFFCPAARPGQRLGDKAVDRLLAEMKKRNIKTYLGKKLKCFNNDSIETESEKFQTDLIMFMPGMTGPAWAANTNLELSEGGFFKANKYCQVEGQNHVFVAGDAGSFPGPDWKPKQAHMADLQAEAAAKNAIQVLGLMKPTNTFKTELICIIDSLDTGSLVYRTEKHGVMMKMPPLHWAKVWFEKHYMKGYK